MEVRLSVTSINVSKAHVDVIYVNIAAFLAAVRRGTFECAGCLTSRLTNLRTAATHRLVTMLVGSTNQGAAQ